MISYEDSRGTPFSPPEISCAQLLGDIRIVDRSMHPDLLEQFAAGQRELKLPDADVDGQNVRFYTVEVFDGTKGGTATAEQLAYMVFGIADRSPRNPKYDLFLRYLAS